MSPAPTATAAIVAGFGIVVDFGDVDAASMTNVVATGLQDAVASITEILTVTPSERRRLLATNFDVLAVVSVPEEASETTTSSRIVDDVGAAITSGDLGDAMVAAAQDLNVEETTIDETTIRDAVLVAESLSLLSTSMSLSTLEPTSVPSPSPTTSAPTPQKKKKKKGRSVSSITIILAVALVVLLLCVALPTLTVCYRSKDGLFKQTIVHVNDRSCETKHNDEYPTTPLFTKIVTTPAPPDVESSPSRVSIDSDDDEIPVETTTETKPDLVTEARKPHLLTEEPNLHNFEWEQMMNDVDEELGPEAWNEEMASLVLFRLARIDGMPPGFAPRSELGSLLELRPDLTAMLGLGDLTSDGIANLLADVRADDSVAHAVSRSQFLHALSVYRSKFDDSFQRNSFHPPPPASTRNPLLQDSSFPPSPPPPLATSPRTPVYATPRK